MAAILLDYGTEKRGVTAALRTVTAIEEGKGQLRVQGFASTSPWNFN